MAGKYPWYDPNAGERAAIGEVAGASGGGGLPVPPTDKGVDWSGFARVFGMDFVSSGPTMSPAGGTIPFDEAVGWDAADYVAGDVDDSMMTFQTGSGNAVLKQAGWYVWQFGVQLAADATQDLYCSTLLNGNLSLVIPNGALGNNIEYGSGGVAYLEVGTTISLSILVPTEDVDINYAWLVLAPLFTPEG